MNASDHLKAAAKIMEERGKQYDSEDGGERSMDAAVRAFNVVTRRDQGSVDTKVATTAISASEGWLLLALLKAVRLFSRPGFHLDSAQDLIAYCALLAEEKGKHADKNFQSR